MKNITLRALCLCLSLCLLSCVLVSPASAEAIIDEEGLADRVDCWEEFLYAPHAAGIAPYKFRSMRIYADFEAEAVGAPEGYSDYVMQLTGVSELGYTVDMTALHILATSVQAIHFKVYYPKNTKEVRVTTDAGHSWNMRYVAANPGTWDDVVLDNPTEIKKLADKDGYLSVFGFGIRYTDSAESTTWVDAIEIEMIPGDDVPPVISYDGPTELNWTAGKPLKLSASAFDEYEQAAMPVTYEWEKGACDANGLPTEGDRICEICSYDSFGNRAAVRLTVHVGPKDTEAPVISFRALRIDTYAGTDVNYLVIPAVDNTDAVTTVNNWSEGAVDPAGRLLPGTHTLTIVCTDETGNETVKTVTVNAK